MQPLVLDLKMSFANAAFDSEDMFQLKNKFFVEMTLDLFKSVKK